MTESRVACPDQKPAFAALVSTFANFNFARE